MSNTSIRIGIADDQRILRDSLRIILAVAADFDVIGEAEDGEAAVALAQRTQPDIMLLDIRMPRLDGIAAARRILADLPATRVLLLTTFDEADLLIEGMQAGVTGFLLKDSSAEELCAAIRAAARGQVMVQGQSVAQLLASLSPAPSAAPDVPFNLTERELSVLRLITQGKTNTEIATALVVSEAAVKTHINHLFAKMNARDRAQAMVLARQYHLV